MPRAGTAQAPAGSHLDSWGLTEALSARFMHGIGQVYLHIAQVIMKHYKASAKILSCWNCCTWACSSRAVLIYINRTGHILKLLMRIHLSLQHRARVLRHCVGCVWNKRVFCNTGWKWKLSLVIMFWLGGISQGQLLPRAQDWSWTQGLLF